MEMVFTEHSNYIKIKILLKNTFDIINILHILLFFITLILPNDINNIIIF